MKKLTVTILLVLSLSALTAQGEHILNPYNLPEMSRLSAKESFFFPFPVKLETTTIELSYISPLSCRLTLESPEGKAVRNLPPLDGKSEISQSFVIENPPGFPISFISLRNWKGDPVPFTLNLTDLKNPTGNLTIPVADHITILSNQDELTDNYILYQWREGENILIFDFKDYNIQDLYLKRLAFFMEKPGYRGTLMTNQEMAGMHGWNAHDYSTEGLASFFNLALEEDFPLNNEEKELKQIILNRGILTFDGEKYLSGSGAVVSITQQSSSVLRHRFLTHESLHGLFFTDSEFRESIRNYWYSMPKNYREIWRFFMQNNFYDPADEVLMYNELLGYTLQLSRVEVENYFVWRFNRIAEIHPEELNYIRSITPYLPEVMLQIYDQLEYITSRRYNYQDGSFITED
jgi:hypothetical protein